MECYMKKILLMVLCLFTMVFFVSCDDSEITLTGDINGTSTKEVFCYDSVEITIAKKDASNNTSDIDKNQIVKPTTDRDFTLEGLTQNKAVLVRITFITSNKSSVEPHTFEPEFTITNSKGYKLSNASSKDVSIVPINEGTSNEGIKVSNLSFTVAPGVSNQKQSFVFVYECTKSSGNLSYIYQNWTFSASDLNNKVIHQAQATLKFPSNYNQISAPKIQYLDNSIEIISEEATYADYMFEADSNTNDGDSNMLWDIPKNNGKYSLPIEKSGKYTIKLRSSDLITQDYEMVFDAIVLDKPKCNLTYDKKLEIQNVAGVTTYELFVYDNSTRLLNSISYIVDDSSDKTVLDVSKILESYDSGNYQIKIYSNSTNNEIFRSVNSTTINLFKLNAPVISVSGKTISWNSIENAYKYEIYLNGELFAEVSTPNLDGSYSYNNRKFSYGDKITVVAYSSEDVTNIYQSNMSNVVEIKSI